MNDSVIGKPRPNRRVPGVGEQINIVQALILALVEGVTEFLPVSSTGHMIVAASWLGLPPREANKAFEVMIQLAAILAVVSSYRDRMTPAHLDLWKKVALAFVPIGTVGLLLHKQIKALFSVDIVAAMFIIGGLVFLLVEGWLRHKSPVVDRMENLSYRQALWIGLAQVLALVPGTSRAGATIIGALLVGLSRKAAAEFSFLLALPVLAAASGFDLLKHAHDFTGVHVAPLLAGFGVAFLAAWAVMHLFLRFLERFTFVSFGLYRIAFGALLLWHPF